MGLSPLELKRYDRQMLISGWGMEGQKKLKASRVTLLGIGGLGSLSSLYLAAAGIGRIIIVDKDRSSLSDLNRQILYSHKTLGRFKAEVAKEELEDLNPEIKVQAVLEPVTTDSVSDVVEGADIVVDGLDNWRTRFVVNDCCVEKGIPFVHAGVSEFYGQITTILPGKGPCLRCIFPKEPREVDVIPVFGAAPAALASLQVMEVIKYLTGIGKPLVGRMLFLDGEEMTFETIEMERNPTCPVCGSPERSTPR
ncbi:MAG: HesA/MoeB/ThiF family protein [Candidatus Bathyarchaeota archaeon]|nr:HesA/MoeB/ThiF family protein [Candidatus Bathyarchaeota archaeon]